MRSFQGKVSQLQKTGQESTGNYNTHKIVTRGSVERGVKTVSIRFVESVTSVNSDFRKCCSRKISDLERYDKHLDWN